ncbi:MAG: phospholipid carrier-dependent glycosyltransferase [Candidatus Marinimicrobia bacterium]|nr:phospholipid carrier-dependent glycosyltransferase [Candidatus Neomarinimicrobiota bacterium]
MKRKKKNPIGPIIDKSLSNYSNLIYQLILGFIFVISYSYIFDGKLDLNGDNFKYLNYATSIIDGNGYSSPHTPDFPPTNWFPPGYSTILALAMFITGKKIVLFKIINGLFFLGTVLIFNNLMRRITDDAVFSFSVSLLLLLNSGLLRYSTILMSEMPYLFFSVLAFYCVSKLNDEIKFWNSKYFYGAVLSAVAAYYLRTIGIVLIGAITIHWLIEKRWKTAAGFLAGFSVLYLPWIIRNSIHGIKGRYLGTIMSVNPWRPEEGQISSIGEFVDKMMINFYDTVIKGFSEVLFPFIRLNGFSKLPLFALGIIILATTLFGAWKLKRYRYLFIFYILGNISVFLIWHGGNGARYVWPLASFIAYCFFYGAYNMINILFESRKKKTPEVLAYGILILSLFFIPKLQEMHKAAKHDYHPAYKNYFELADSVKKMGNNDLVIACRKPAMFYYYSNAYVTNYKFSLNDKEVLKHLIDKQVDFVVLEQLGYSSTVRYLYPAIQKNNELFQVKLHLKNPDSYLLSFDAEKAKKKLNL